MTHTARYMFDPHYTYNQIVVVGLGGTGSQAARCIARLLYHRQQKGQQIPQVLFVDPDGIEPHNVGRQMFTPADVGNSKVETLARRFNLALGLAIEWSTEPLDSDRHIRPGALVCGCVDNHAARAEIARHGNCTWIDAGNGYDFGQVAIGNSGERERILETIQADRHPWRYLPHAGLLFPALLEAEPDEEKPEALSCAEQVARDEQRLYVNDFMGVIVAEYVYKLLNREPIDTFLTYLSLDPPLVSSKAISPQEVAAHLNVQAVVESRV